LREIFFVFFFAFFAPLADKAKGGDRAKSAFRGYSVSLLIALNRQMVVPVQVVTVAFSGSNIGGL
jgi:hypothetical protein